MKSVMFISIAFLIALSFWCGSEYRKDRIYAELNKNQQTTIGAQRIARDSLRNQLKHNQNFSDAYDKTSYGAAAKWRDGITVEVGE